MEDYLCSIGLIAVGIVLLIWRDEIGGFTGYYTGRGGFVDKPTPGWMLIPFALAFIAGGIFLCVRLLFERELF